jgi:hypothetical protein
MIDMGRCPPKRFPFDAGSPESNPNTDAMVVLEDETRWRGRSNSDSEDVNPALGDTGEVGSLAVKSMDRSLLMGDAATPGTFDEDILSPTFGRPNVDNEILSSPLPVEPRFMMLRDGPLEMDTIDLVRPRPARVTPVSG